MDKEKIGAFIALKRKEKNLTQQEFGNLIGAGNKTVSRWEKGYAMPDADFYENICRTLDISVNELLAGEKIPDKKFYQVAEKNLVTMSKENEKISQKATVKESVVIAAGFVILFTVLTFLNKITADVTLVNYIDIPTILTFVLLGAVALILEGSLLNFFRGFASAVSWKYYKCLSSEETAEQLRALKASLINNILIGILVALMGLIPFFQTNYSEDNSTLLPNIAICLLPLLYAVIADLIILPFDCRLTAKNRMYVRKP